MNADSLQVVLKVMIFPSSSPYVAKQISVKSNAVQMCCFFFTTLLCHSCNLLHMRVLFRTAVLYYEKHMHFAVSIWLLLRRNFYYSLTFKFKTSKPNIG